MTTGGNEALGSLIHDLNSKCASLKTAIGLLRSASPEEIGEILALMKQQASGIAEDIASFEASVKGK